MPPGRGRSGAPGSSAGLPLEDLAGDPQLPVPQRAAVLEQVGVIVEPALLHHGESGVGGAQVSGVLLAALVAGWARMSASGGRALIRSRGSSAWTRLVSMHCRQLSFALRKRESCLSHRHADSADLWSWLVIAAHTQLRLARPLTVDLRRPWERSAEPRRLTPAIVRRGFRNVRTTTARPAAAPKPSKPGPGRPPGTKNKHRAKHHDVGKTVKRTEARTRVGARERVLLAELEQVQQQVKQMDTKVVVFAS